MSTPSLFNPQESAILIAEFQRQNYHQYSCAIIRKVLEAKSFRTHEPLVVQALLEVMGNVLGQFKQMEADTDSILQLSKGLYNLLLQVECVEAD